MRRIDSETVRHILDTANIVDVVSDFVSLKRRGANYVGLCPFHNEKSASFSVNGDLQVYHCFGCGAGGNVYTFVMNYENYTFPEAVRMLAERAGVALPQEDGSEEARRRGDRRARLLEVNKAAAKFFYFQLRSPHGEIGYRYLKKRELTDETMRKFGLGFAGKDGANLVKYLREKEKMIQKQLDEGIDYAAGEVTVISLLERYISLKQGVRYNTKVGYNFVLNLIKKEDFGYRQIRDIKVSDAQQWIMKLHNDGKGYSTITSVRGVVKPAFQMAYNEDIIRRNPFDFKLVDVVPNDSQKRIAMTEEQQELWMRFIREDKTYCKYYDEFVVLLGTGMRVSEFCGLTKSDLDFESRKIRVDHQLVRERGGKYYVEKTKTECGCRFIPMTEEVYRSLKKILIRRKSLKTEMIVDGYSNFLLLDKDDKPKVALHIENEMRWAMKKYKKLHPDKPLPHITPHVFRHTFCTNMANAGMEIKTLQYVMGHSDVGVTLNVYTHASYDRAAEQMAKILDFKETDMQGKQRKSG